MTNWEVRPYWADESSVRPVARHEDVMSSRAGGADSTPAPKNNSQTLEHSIEKYKKFLRSEADKLNTHKNEMGKKGKGEQA
ncbi:hypothetical protein O5O45_09725 [Hahella aquimaris]|uniref:hypothetical protein n=1 Tax=Hahella sp. HNIBRBA332 TaxID=3015983 RepID=UPI00273AB86D|nr:hypothetical protein [Hahella sp. HNIBRBA332]WLQ16192.1 hypothetical protein O5O45_09725 [Hahella sp. HNIBRBA332]